MDVSTTGTLTARAVSASSAYAMLKRIAFRTATISGSSAGTRHNHPQFMLAVPGTSSFGGFYYSCTFAISGATSASDIVAGTKQDGVRAAVGMFSASTSVLNNDNPSNNGNFIALAFNTRQPQWAIMSARGNNTAVTVSLGANFPTTGSMADSVFVLNLYSPPSASSVEYTVYRYAAGGPFSSSGFIHSSSLPASTSLLAPQVWINNGSKSIGEVAIEVSRQYLETDFWYIYI